MIRVIPPQKGSRRPLFFRRPGELALPAFLQLCIESRTVRFGCWEPNTEPKKVSLGYEIWRKIDVRLSGRAAVQIAKDIEPILERICAGYCDDDYNGHDHVCVLNADATAAVAEMTARLQEILSAE